MKSAGFDAYGYRGFRQQSLEMATLYYGGYAKQVGFYKTVTADYCRDYPDCQQYIGKVVNGVEGVIVMGAYRFPTDTALAELAEGAKAQITHTNRLDTIVFGRWKN